MQEVVGSSPIFSTTTGYEIDNQQFIKRPDEMDVSDSDALRSAQYTVGMNTYSLPRLFNAGGDLSKEWYIDFYFNNRRKKITKGLNEIALPDERQQFADAECNRYRLMLASGWNPFLDKKKISGNHLKYKHETESYNIEYFLNAYCDECKSTLRLRDKSYSTYFTKIMRFKSWLQEHRLSQLMPGQFTAAHANDFMNDVRAGKITRDKKPVANKTYNSYRGVMLCIWNWIERKDENLITKNPWLKCAKLKVSRKRKFPYTDDQREKIFAHLEEHEPRLLLLIKLIYYLFIRPGREMRGLQVQDIDFAENKIWIEEDIAKNKKTQYLPLLQELRESFEKLEIQNYPGTHFIFGKEGISEKQAPYNYWINLYASHMRQLEIPKHQTLYTWKDTGNKRYHENGMSPHFQKRLNRHASLDQMNTYLDDWSAIKSEQVERFL